MSLDFLPEIEEKRECILIRVYNSIILEQLLHSYKRMHYQSITISYQGRYRVCCGLYRLMNRERTLKVGFPMLKITISETIVGI